MRWVNSKNPNTNNTDIENMNSAATTDPGNDTYPSATSTSINYAHLVQWQSSTAAFIFTALAALITVCITRNLIQKAKSKHSKMIYIYLLFWCIFRVTAFSLRAFILTDDNGENYKTYQWTSIIASLGFMPLAEVLAFCALKSLALMYGFSNQKLHRLDLAIKLCFLVFGGLLTAFVVDYTMNKPFGSDPKGYAGLVVCREIGFNGLMLITLTALVVSFGNMRPSVLCRTQIPPHLVTAFTRMNGMVCVQAVLMVVKLVYTMYRNWNPSQGRSEVLWYAIGMAPEFVFLLWYVRHDTLLSVFDEVEAALDETDKIASDGLKLEEANALSEGSDEFLINRGEQSLKRPDSHEMEQSQLHRLFHAPSAEQNDLIEPAENLALVGAPLSFRSSLAWNYTINTLLRSPCATAVFIAARHKLDSWTGPSLNLSTCSPQNGDELAQVTNPPQTVLSRIVVKSPATAAGLRKLLAAMPTDDEELGSQGLPCLIIVDDLSAFFDTRVDSSENVRFTLALLNQTVQTIRNQSTPGTPSSQCHFLVTDLAHSHASAFDSIHRFKSGSVSTQTQSLSMQSQSSKKRRQGANGTARLSVSVDQILDQSVDWTIQIQGHFPTFMLEAKETRIRKYKTQLAISDGAGSDLPDSMQGLQFHFRVVPAKIAAHPASSENEAEDCAEWEDVGHGIALESVALTETSAK
ncbi:hypothetical protein HDU77_008787 [Chytriomyces hyalinus]|nr:hypothetical protein HDU77_008787 [Chytriomyces hyalinus]